MKNNYKLAVFFSLLANFMFALINVTINKLPYSINAMKLFFFQMMFSCLFLFPWIFRKGFGVVKTKQLKLHVQRAVIAIFSVYFFYTSLRILSPVDAVLIKSTSPFFVPALALFWLGEKIPKITWFLVFLGFIGVYLVIGPFDSNFTFAHLFPLLAAVGYAYMIVSLKRLRLDNSPEQILLYYNATAMLLLSPLIIFTWQPLPFELVLILVGLGLLFALGQIAIVLAYSYSMPGKLAPFIFSEVFFTYLVYQILFGVTISTRELLGGILIVCSALLMLWVMHLQGEPTTD